MMVLLAAYVCVWMAVSAMVAVAAEECADSPHSPSTRTRLAILVLAGAIWPVLAVALVQIVVFRFVWDRLAASHRPDQRREVLKVE